MNEHRIRQNIKGWEMCKCLADRQDLDNDDYDHNDYNDYLFISWYL